jgi:hypothetical protein
MATLVVAIHFPEAAQDKERLWKMDGPDEPGHDSGWCCFWISAKMPR